MAFVFVVDLKVKNIYTWALLVLASLTIESRSGLWQMFYDQEIIKALTRFQDSISYILPVYTNIFEVFYKIWKNFIWVSLHN